MKKKIALIFGVSGQDGSYLAEFLIKKKYTVIGVTRNKSKKNLYRLEKLKILNKVKLVKCSFVSIKFVDSLLEKNKNSRLLVGTWKSAKWAIKFYEKFGFIVHTTEQSSLLLKKYWNISSKQIENSVVLEKYK